MEDEKPTTSQCFVGSAEEEKADIIMNSESVALRQIFPEEVSP